MELNRALNLMAKKMRDDGIVVPGFDSIKSFANSPQSDDEKGPDNLASGVDEPTRKAIKVPTEPRYRHPVITRRSGRRTSATFVSEMHKHHST